MKNAKSGKLIILAGPSCVGKSPLAKSMAKFFPEFYRHLKMLVMYNSRDPRPGEVDGIDYHFRSRKEINKLRDDDDFLVLDARGDLQAVDLRKLKDQLDEGDVFYEGNPFAAAEMIDHPGLMDIPKLDVFMSPVSRNEILYLKEHKVSLPDVITDVMRRKLLRRTRRQKNELSLNDLQNIEKRASSAYQELRQACRFTYILPNHDGEDSENWDAFYFPLGDARKSLLCFLDLIKGAQSSVIETWEENLMD